MSLAVGIDLGAYKCAAAVCRQGEREAERKVLNITTKRGGFAELDGWMAKQGAPIDVVVMESSGHYWFNLGAIEPQIRFGVSRSRKSLALPEHFPRRCQRCLRKWPNRV